MNEQTNERTNEVWRVTWATSVPILVFLSLSVLNLCPMYATDRQTDIRRQTASSLNPPPRYNNNNRPSKVILETTSIKLTEPAHNILVTLRQST